MKTHNLFTGGSNRRSFLKRGVVAGAATLGSSCLVNGISALGKDRQKGSLSEGDAAILRFVAAAEILESDLWNSIGNSFQRRRLSQAVSPLLIRRLAPSQLPLGETPSTRPLLRSSMATCLSTLTIIPTTNSATRTSWSLT